MKNKNIDKQFRNMEDTSNVQPPEFIWNNIDKELNGKNRKWMWWFSLSSLILVAGILSWAYLNQDSDKLSYNESKRTKASVVKEQNLMDYNKTEKNIHDIKAEINSDSKKAKIISSNPAKSIAINSDQARELETLPNTPLTAKLDNDLVQAETSDASIPEAEASSNSIKIEIFDHKLLTRNNILFDVNYNKGTASLTKNNTVSNVSTPKLRRLSSFVEFGLSVGHHNQQFRNNTSFAKQRKETEAEWYNWGGYAKYGVQIRPSWSISAGLQQIEHKDIYSYTKENAIRFQVTTNPDTGQPTDSSLITGKYISEGEIKYTNTDFTLGTTFTKNFEMFNLGCEITGIYNVNTTVSGKSLAASGTETRLENEHSLYRKNLGLGYQFNGVVQYKSNQNIIYSLKPFYKSYLNNWNTET